MAHSKRNTSLAFFTSHERADLRNAWGSQEARLKRDSFLAFASCSLCLVPSKDPVACAGGPLRVSSDLLQDDAPPAKKRRRTEHQECHIFCRECAMSYLLAQRKEIKRLEKLGEADLAALTAAEAKEDDEVRRRAVHDFENVQMGLATKPVQAKHHMGHDSPKGGPGLTAHEQNVESFARNSSFYGKRKLSGSVDEPLGLGEDDRARARRTLRDQILQESKSSLPPFWVPALTPNQTRSGSAEDSLSRNRLSAKRQPLCPCSDSDTTHTLSLKSLVTVNFKEDGTFGSPGHAGEGSPSAATERLRVCPACDRPLSNASKAFVAKACGHVLCGQCTVRFVLQDDAPAQGQFEAAACFVCNKDIHFRLSSDAGKDKSKHGLMAISSDGTGFAKGGKSLIKKTGVAFQC